VRDDELLDQDKHGEAQAIGISVEFVGEMAVRDDPMESYREVSLKLEKKPFLDFVRGVGREGISSRGETVYGGTGADGGRVALRAGRVGVERAGGTDSGRGGSGVVATAGAMAAGGRESSVSSSGESKASMLGSSVALSVAAWNLAKASALNRSGAARKRREAARALVSASVPGSESTMSGASASSREGAAISVPEASADGRFGGVRLYVVVRGEAPGGRGVGRGEDGAGQRRGPASGCGEGETAFDDVERLVDQLPDSVAGRGVATLCTALSIAAPARDAA